MSVTKRIYVEKKDDFAVEAHNLFHDLKEHLHLENLPECKNNQQV